MKTKRLFLTNVVALFICLVMLLGSTYAWFTDYASSKDNVIHSGVLDVEMYWSDTLIPEDSADWKNAENASIFTYDRWEPGYTEVKYIKVVNKGNLSFKWKIDLEAEGNVTKLAEVIDVYSVNPVESALTKNSLNAGNLAGTLSETIGTSIAEGVILPSDEASVEYPSVDTILAIAFHMQEEAGNEYAGLSLGDGCALSVKATQFNYEEGAFGDGYDANAQWPSSGNAISNSASAPVNTTAENKVADKVTLISDDKKIFADVPAGVQLDPDVDTLTLTVADVLSSKANVTLDENEAALSIDVHVNGVAENNDVVMPITIKELLPVGLNMGNYRFYHVENGATVEMELLTAGATPVHNNYDYNPATGDVVLYLKSFSEVALVADTENAWGGSFDYSWYTETIKSNSDTKSFTIANADQLAAFGAIVGGMAEGIEQDSFKDKTVKLLADINLGYGVKENAPIFYPIGYNSSDGKYEKTGVAVTTGFYNFCGTFDGNGHTVSNFYHNTWEMKGDNNYYDATLQYYRDGMGLFGRVYGGTIKNLTVSNFSSDGEYTTTGVIAAYADGATFENIAITNCNPRVYNIGNGGIVGCVGWYAKEENLKTTFKNITVDNSNKISALWGSYDVACGGIVGQYYPTSGQSSANKPANGGVHFENCHVSAVMDVYNDVCANYQYYAYRYAGMMIGSIRENTTNEDGKTIPDMTGISATNCTVNYGDWNDYYYCEFEKNGHPSYSGPDDYKFSRVPHSELNFTDSNGNGVVDADERASVTGCKHNHTDKENNQAISLPFYQLFTGYGWGVNSIGLEKYSGIVTNLDITEGDQQESVEKFKGKVTELANNKEYKFGDIFNFVDKGVELMPEAIVVGVHNLDEKNPVSANIVYDRTNWENGTITLTGTGKVKITIQDYYFCTPTTITVEITDRQPEVKFETKFTGDCLYRVGNQNAVALGSLFKAKDGAKIGSVSVTVEALNDTAASGTYTSNATWTNGTIQFSGTGVVKVTITDNDYCKATELYLEVVDAKNVTGAESATSNNVVLLQNVGFSSLEVSGGYTLYGNGFTMTCGSDSVAKDRTYSFVELKGGTLDNVQIVVPNFSHAIMYEKNKTENGNPSNTDSNGTTRYYNVRSAVLVSATSKITNSYISGGRAAIYLTSGDLTIENSTIYGGAVANIQTEASSNLILEDVTLIQKPIKANVNDTSKTVMGLSVVMMCDTTGIGSPVTLKGYLHQYAWAHEGYTQYVPSDGQSAVSNVLSKDEFIHSITYSDGITRNSVNLGFAYMPDGLIGTKADNMEDKRSDSEKTKCPYDTTTVSSVATIYTYKNTNGTDDSVKTEPTYTANTQGVVLPFVKFEDANENRVFTTTYDATNARWKSTLKVDVDAGVYSFSFAKLLAQKYGKNLLYTVKTEDGTVVDKNATITLNSAVSNVYYLTITDNQIYDKDGNLTGETVETTYMFELQSTKTSLPAPIWKSTTPNGTPYIVVDSKGGDWNCAVPVLDGLKIKYWSKKQNKEIELDLANVVSAAGLSKGLQNGSNNTITITVADEYTLTVTTTGFKTNDNGKPVVVNGKLYFTVSSSSNYVSTSTTSRTPNISYVFTDANNSAPISLNTSFNVVYANYKNTQYKYSDFCNGTLTEASSGVCITPDTLITLADGTQVSVDSLTGNEELLVWNHETGKLDKAPVAYIVDHNGVVSEREIIHLNFANGKTVKIIGEHVFFDATLNKYVAVNAENVDSFIGHTFVALGSDGETIEKVKLVSIEREITKTKAYEVVSYKHLTCFTEGILSTSAYLDPLLNTFDIDKETLAYDAESVQKDIETYGLYTYADFEGLISEEAFELYNAAYLKIAIGKGYITWDDVLEMIDIYFDVDVQPIQ